MLISLHWLAIKQHIEYKWATVVFHCFDGTLPPYLSHCLTLYTPHRSLWSSSDKLLSAPRVNLKSTGLRSFLYQAPCVWNSVPIQTWFSTSLISFKSSLKMHLFCAVFTWDSEIKMGGGGGGVGGLQSVWLTGEPAAAAFSSALFVCGSGGARVCVHVLCGWCGRMHVFVSQCGGVYVCPWVCRCLCVVVIQWVVECEML